MAITIGFGQNAHSLAEPTWNFFNTLLQLGVVPEQMQIARVVPLPKVNNPKSTNDYRPISVMSVKKTKSALLKIQHRISNCRES